MVNNVNSRLAFFVGPLKSACMIAVSFTGLGMQLSLVMVTDWGEAILKPIVRVLELLKISQARMVTV